jgi:apolipoprotein D and lipocalin family protein
MTVCAALHLPIRNYCVRLPKALLIVSGLVMSSIGGYANDLPPIKPVAPIDLPRFMGKWYVIASIPTHFEKDAYNAVET